MAGELPDNIEDLATDPLRALAAIVAAQNPGATYAVRGQVMTVQEIEQSLAENSPLAQDLRRTVARLTMMAEETERQS